MSIRHALLALLADDPQHGLGLKQRFEAHTGEIWPLNVGQVYSTLQRLERDEFVMADAEGSDARQRVYELTRAGRVELDEWLNAASKDPTPPRDELVIKVLVAIAVDGVDPMPIIDRHRAQLLETMQHFTKLKVHDDGLATALVADAELFRLDGAVRWLDMAEARLRRGETFHALVVTHSDEASDVEADGSAKPDVAVSDAR